MGCLKEAMRWADSVVAGLRSVLNCVGVCYNAIDQQSMMCEENNKLLLEYNITEEEANFVVLFDFNLTIFIFIYVLLYFLLFFPSIFRCL